MNLFNKVVRLSVSLINSATLFFIKLSLGNSINIGHSAHVKGSSKIKIWDNDGEIVIGDCFSMGYNSELYVWNGLLSVGDNTSINDNCKIYGNVSIGAGCLLASNIFISSGSHTFLERPNLPIKVQDKLKHNNNPIVIEDDCWIGSGVVIMPGTYIGKGAIIGANSVVTRNIYPYTVNAGSPCREIRKRTSFSKGENIIESYNEKHWPFFYRGFNYRQFENLNTLDSGIQIADTSIFLLRKINGRILNLLGSCDSDTRLEIFLNNNAYGEQSVERGKFDLAVSLIDQKASCLEFDQLSSDIQDEFDVVIIKLYGMQGADDLKYKCRMISVGIS